MSDHDFTLPPGVEVPEMAEWQEHRELAGIETERGLWYLVQKSDRLAADLCRVVREQEAEKAELEKMLRLAVSYYSVNEAGEAIDLLRRRVREEGEDG